MHSEVNNYRLLVKHKKQIIYNAWVNFTVFCKKAKEKQYDAQKAVDLFKLKTCFATFKSLLIIRANRIEFQKERETRSLRIIFRGFRRVIRKSIILSESYCEVASKYRTKLAQKALDKWYYVTNDRINAKQAIEYEIHEQRLQEIYVNELNIKRKAFESLKINMVPRRKTMNKLVEKYYMEHLKSKGLKAFKTYYLRKKNERKATKIVQTETKIKYFKCWIMLFNEKSISKNLKTPFVNLQKQAYEEDWSLQKLNLNTEKVYSFLSYGKRKHAFMAWRAWTHKIAHFKVCTKIIK